MRKATKDPSVQAPEILNCNASEMALALGVVAEKAAGPIFSLDRQYRYTGFNIAHARMMKQLYDADIALGHSLNEYMLVPADWQTAKKNLDRALRGEAFLETAYSGSDDRRRRYFAVVHNPIHDGDDKVVGVSLFAQDITDRRQLQEAELRKSEQKFRTVADYTYDWQDWMLPDGSLE